MLLWLFAGDAGDPPSEALSAGDLTTAFSKWLAGEGHPKNEAMRAALNAHYGTSNADLDPLAARFLKDRQ